MSVHQRHQSPKKEEALFCSAFLELFLGTPGRSWLFARQTVTSWNVFICRFTKDKFNVRLYYKLGKLLLQSGAALMYHKAGQVLSQSETACLYYNSDWYYRVAQLQSMVEQAKETTLNSGVSCTESCLY